MRPLPVKLRRRWRPAAVTPISHHLAGERGAMPKPLSRTPFTARSVRSTFAAKAVALSFVLTLLSHPGYLSRSAADEFVHTRAPLVVLTHVRVIDGTGTPAKPDQTLVIEGGRVKQIGAAADTPAPPGALVLDLSGHTVIPGLVGMHEHL